MAAYRGKHSVYLLDLPSRLGVLSYVMSECQVVRAVIKKVAAVKLETSLSEN